MKILGEFREFISRGSVVDLAVGVIIGAAFGKIVTAVVEDLIMPLVGMVLPSGDWRNAGLTLRAAGDAAHPAVVVKFGHLLGVAVDFLIVAFVLFLVIQAINRFKDKPAEAPATPTTRDCPACLESIPRHARRCKYCTEVVTPA